MNKCYTYRNPTKLDVLLTAASRLQVNPVTYAVRAMLRDPTYYTN